jgi:DNA repair exonuclease SbcCD ATPase subunit
MTDNQQNFNSLQERNQQVLSDISQLQDQEKQLYDSLDDVTLSSEQKQQIITKINEISQIRLNVYAGLKDMYSFYQKDVSASRGTLGQEMSALEIMENELNEAKRRLNKIQDEKNKLVFDHCHKMNKFRGYCCNSCNRSLGVLGDDVEGIINVLNYLLISDPMAIRQDESGKLHIQK